MLMAEAQIDEYELMMMTMKMFAYNIAVLVRYEMMYHTGYNRQ